jgi:hypothetical protein
MVNLVRAIVGVNCFVGIADEVEAIFPSLIGQCRLGLVDGRPNIKICGLGAQLGLECIVETKNIRRGVAGWHHDTYALKHCDVGG